ncbi:transporter [Lithospermum erythrorhizon]|uniref:Transporter n=1 Tax=Lithospermum erythrorhizon TaxID=34254 RepID=A0AAV3QXZ6_LITER
MLMLLAVSHFFEGLQCILSGNPRGCGWQKIGAIVNLGSYYLFGIPTGILLAFTYHIGGKGLWMGITVALFAQTSILLIIGLKAAYIIQL